MHTHITRMFSSLGVHPVTNGQVGLAPRWLRRGRWPVQGGWKAPVLLEKLQDAVVGVTMQLPGRVLACKQYTPRVRCLPDAVLSRAGDCWWRIES